jgi:hypothetical protein
VSYGKIFLNFDDFILKYENGIVFAFLVESAQYFAGCFAFHFGDIADLLLGLADAGLPLDNGHKFWKSAG